MSMTKVGTCELNYYWVIAFATISLCVVVGGAEVAQKCCAGINKRRRAYGGSRAMMK